MEIVILPDEQWFQIFKDLQFKFVNALLCTSKRIQFIINGKILLKTIDYMASANDELITVRTYECILHKKIVGAYTCICTLHGTTIGTCCAECKIMPIDYQRQLQMNNVFITDMMLTMITNDTDINPQSMLYRNYYMQSYEKNLLLKYIINNNVTKTILMLKLFGNQNIFFHLDEIVENFQNVMNKLRYYLKECDGYDLLEKPSYLNLHFAFMIFFSSFDFLKQIICYMQTNINNLCFFAYNFDPICSSEIKTLHTKARKSFYQYGSGKLPNFTKCTINRNDIAQKLNYFENNYKSHVNFAWFSPKRFNYAQQSL